MSECMTQEDAMNMNNEQAIQILKPLRDMMIDQHGCPISSAVFALDRAIEALSAQPEIIRCKDCKHHWTHKCMDSMPIERCDLEQTFYDAEVDYCSLAERRTNVWKEVKK